MDDLDTAVATLQTKVNDIDAEVEAIYGFTDSLEGDIGAVSISHCFFLISSLVSLSSLFLFTLVSLFFPLPFYLYDLKDCLKWDISAAI